MGLRDVVLLTLGAVCGCAQFGSGSDDEEPLGDASPGPGDDSDAQPELGTEARPAADCAELRDAGSASGVGWVRHPDGVSPAFQVYCEQELNGGGWAMLYNSVLKEDGTTTAFWQFDYAARLGRMGTPAPDENYYQGSLYLIGTAYFDAITDLAGSTAVAAEVMVEGFDQASMAFIAPVQLSGNLSVFTSQFATGWSSKDHDADSYEMNCATVFADVAQHYSACWAYNLGADAGGEVLDGGVGPHVNITSLGDMGLMTQPDGGDYSRVQRIARFTRW